MTNRGFGAEWIQTDSYKTSKGVDRVALDIVQGDKGPQADKLHGNMSPTVGSSEAADESAPTSSVAL